MFQRDVRFISRSGCIGPMTLLLVLNGFMTTPLLTSAKTYLQGENATLVCNSNSVDPRSPDARPFTLVWKKLRGEVAVTVASFVSGVLKVKSDGPLAGRAEFKPPVLYIRKLKVTDSGTYRCDIVDLGGETTSNSMELEVNAVPNVEVDIANSPRVDASGKYVAAVCHASGGKPPATIQWIYSQNGDIQESENLEEALGDGSFNVRSKLLLKPGFLERWPNSTEPVTEKDWRKNFTCLVYHDYIENQQQAVTVPVDLLYPPVVTISVKSNKLTCNAMGNPAPSITWKRPDGSVEIGSASIFVDQTTPKASTGRYVCLARSSIGPDAVSTINVQKSKDLPALSVSLRYNASLPLKAKNYEMECTAELVNMERSAVEVAAFVWSKDGKPIEERLSRYSIRQTTDEISEEKTMVKSVLRIIEVNKNHDEGRFDCRLSLPTPGTGYVRTVQREINVKVDYPPANVITAVHPDTTVREHTDVRLSCRAASSPASSYLWYFNGEVKSTRAQYILRNISRSQAGTYKCVAYNYVPGSAFRKVRLVVEYPPGRVRISRIRSSLSCSTEGGSVPSPLYTWLLPNGTVTDGNTSFLEISSLDMSSSESYTCLVGNGLEKASNTSFRLPGPDKVGVGSLTIGEFVVTVIISILLLVILIVFAVCVVKRYEWGRKASVTKAKDTKGSTLLQYTEPRYEGSLASMSVPHNVFDDTRLTGGSVGTNGKPYTNSNTLRVKNSYNASASPSGKNPAMSPQIAGKPALVNYVTLPSKSNLQSLKEGDKEIPSRYRSVEVLDGSGVEILENSSMASIKGRESTLPRANTNSPSKMTTFSQPPGIYSRAQGLKNYNTTRNPAREKIKDAILTRALSENFRPAPLDDSVKSTKSGTSANSNSPKKSRVGAGGVQIPVYTGSDCVRVASPRPAMSTPIPPGQSQILQKSDKETGYYSDSSGASSSTGKPSFDYQHVTSASHIGGCANQAYPGFRQNTVNHDMYNGHPEMDFRPSPLPSRCPSVDPYHVDCTPSMVEIPTRNYLYNPYADTRLGLAPSGAISSLHTTPTTVGSPYDSGAESKSSNATTATSGGRRMQSLTLV